LEPHNTPETEKLVLKTSVGGVVGGRINGHGEQPGPAPGGSAGRSENLQATGGVQRAPEREDGGQAVPDQRARIHDQRTFSHRYCDMKWEGRKQATGLFTGYGPKEA